MKNSECHELQSTFNLIFLGSSYSRYLLHFALLNLFISYIFVVGSILKLGKYFIENQIPSFESLL